MNKKALENVLFVAFFVVITVAATINGINLHNQVSKVNAAIEQVKTEKKIEKQDTENLKTNHKEWAKLDGGHWNIPKSWKKDLK